MHIEELEQIKQNFLQELRDASAGKKTSLPFLKHTLPASPLVKMGETFQVMVVGGSNFQSAIVKKEGKEIKIIKQKNIKIAPYATKEEFFRFILKHLEQDIRVLAMNFAFALDPLLRENKLDGKFVLAGSKEHTFEGLVNTYVGETIEKYIEQKQQKKVNVAIANDTICLLLSGLIKYPWDSLACLIVGTGLNNALFLNKQTAVNIEVSHFSKFRPTESGKQIDKESKFPGSFLFQKEISGAHLFTHFNFLIKQGKINHPFISSTKKLSLLARQNNEVGKTAKAILLRSASMVASHTAAVSLFCKRPLIFITEGSLFWQGYEYKKTVEQTIRRLSPLSRVTFVAIPNSAILGAAKLVA